MSEQLQKKITELESKITELSQKVNVLEEELKAHIDDLKTEAFPGADLSEHHDTHLRQIERAKEWSDNWKGLRKKIFEGAGYAFVLFVAGAVGVAVKTWVKS